MDRSQFTFYKSFWNAVKRLRKKEDRLSALEAICAYALDGETRPMTDAADAIFVLIQPVLDTAARKAETGKNGGSKPKANGKQTESKQQADGNQSEREKEKEKEKENEIEKESYISAREEIIKELESAPQKKRFKPPTLEEVIAYCKERNSSVDPRQFFEYFQAGNWMDSKGQKVKNWKQKLLTWEKFQPKKPQPSGREALEELWAEYKAEGSAGMGELPEWIDKL